MYKRWRINKENKPINVEFRGKIKGVETMKNELPMTKDCKYCTHYSETKCYMGRFELNQDKLVDNCYYSEGKRKTLEAFDSMVNSGELKVYEFEIKHEDLVKEPTEELRKLLSNQSKTLVDYIEEDRGDN